MSSSMLMCDTNTHDVPSTVTSPTKRELQEKYLARYAYKKLLMLQINFGSKELKSRHLYPGAVAALYAHLNV